MFSWEIQEIINILYLFFSNFTSCFSKKMWILTRKSQPKNVINGPLWGRLSLKNTSVLSGSSLVGAAPDVHLFRLCNQLISELRMGQTDDALCPFPGGLAFCIKFTVLCHQPVQVGAGVAVTTDPSSRVGRMRDFNSPLFLSLTVAGQQMKLLPPLER